MMRAARWLFAAVAWALVAGIALQVFLIGLGLFVNPEDRQLHATFGWILHLAPAFVVITAALAGAGRAALGRAIALAITLWIVPILAAIRTDLPVAAAFHPIGAFLVFWLAIVVALAATRLIRSDEPAASTTRNQWIVVLVVAVVLVALSIGGPSA